MCLLSDIQSTTVSALNRFKLFVLHIQKPANIPARPVKAAHCEEEDDDVEHQSGDAGKVGHTLHCHA